MILNQWPEKLYDPMVMCLVHLPPPDQVPCFLFQNKCIQCTMSGYVKS